MNCQMPPGKSRLSCVRDSLCGCHHSTFLLFQSPGLQATLASWIQRVVILPWLGTSHLLPGGSASTVPMRTLKWKERDSCNSRCFFMCLWIFRKQIEQNGINLSFKLEGKERNLVCKTVYYKEYIAMEKRLTGKEKQRKKKRKIGFSVLKVNRMNLIPTRKNENNFKRMKLRTRRQSTQRF